MNGENAILVELGAVLAIALGLHTALGPLISSLIESIKPTGLVPDNWAGVWALGLSTVLGLVFGILAAIRVDEPDAWRYVAYGAIAGLLGPGAGAIRSAQARAGIVASQQSNSTAIVTNADATQAIGTVQEYDTPKDVVPVDTPTTVYVNPIPGTTLLEARDKSPSAVAASPPGTL